MFTVEQINQAHAAVKSGADFPAYIRTIKAMGVTGFETWVRDSHTEYYGDNQYSTSSTGQYADLTIAQQVDKDRFQSQLKVHQAGETDYLTFCKDCAATGIEKWIVDLSQMTCTYYDQQGNEILVEEIPG